MEMFRSLKNPSATKVPTSLADKAYARDLIDSEMAKFDINLGHPYDCWITTLYYFSRDDPVSEVLKALYYRSRVHNIF
jgi:hypothetical protein